MSRCRNLLAFLTTVAASGCALVPGQGHPQRVSLPLNLARMDETIATPVVALLFSVATLCSVKLPS
jgi:hypothetical protein